MGATDSNGIWKYDSSDTINGWPTYGNLLANSVSNVFTDIRPKAIYTASSQSDANTKVTALKASGLTPSTAAPFFFWRTDTSSLWVYNNSTWYNTAVTTSSATPTSSAGYDTSRVRISKVGNIVTVNGSIRKSSENVTNSTESTALTIPSGYRPSADVEFAAFGAASSTSGRTGWGWITSSGNLGYGLTGSGPVNRVVFSATYTVS